MTVPIPFGTTLLIAAAACLLGAFVSHLFAAIIAAILLVLALIAFAMRRAGRVLENIFDQELSSPRDPQPHVPAQPPMQRQPQPHV